MMRYIFILFLVFNITTVSAQGLEYGAALDTTYMLIGDQQKLTFVVSNDEPVSVIFPPLKDTVVRGVEIVSGPFRDSVKEKQGRWKITESYVITSFDTGVYIIPPMKITINKEEYNSVLTTDPLGFVVNTYQLKEDQSFFDIVMPYTAVLSFAEIFPYLLYGLVALLLIALLVWFIIKRKKNEPFFKTEKAIVQPYVKAIKSLNEIKEDKLWQSGRTKEYYIRMTDTVRLYIEEELGILAMEQTSFETIRSLENCRYIHSEIRSKLSEMMQFSDLVKFAKMTSLPDDNARNLSIAYDVVEHVNDNIRLEKQQMQEQKEAKGNEEDNSKDEL